MRSSSNTSKFHQHLISQAPTNPLPTPVHEISLHSHKKLEHSHLNITQLHHRTRTLRMQENRERGQRSNEECNSSEEAKDILQAVQGGVHSELSARMRIGRVRENKNV
jgi:hypothetical protein